MNSSSFKSLVKFGIVIFILYAAIQYNGARISNFFSEVKDFGKSFTAQEDKSETALPKTIKTEQNKAAPEKSNSKKFEYIPVDEKEGLFSHTLNKVFSSAMNNPKFSYIVEKAIEDSIKTQARIVENDPAFGRIMTQDIQPGSGPIANCGDTVKIAYNIYSVKDYDSNPNIDSSQKVEKTIHIGKNTLHQGLENTIIGMSKSGMRKGVFFTDLQENTVSKLNTANKAEILVANIELKEIIKKDKKSNLIIHATRNAKPGEPLPLCGHKISFVYSITDVNGNKISEKENNIITLQTGVNLPPEINQALMQTPPKNISLTIIGKPKDILENLPKSNLYIPDNIIEKNQIVVLNLTRPNVR